MAEEAGGWGYELQSTSEAVRSARSLPATVALLRSDVEFLASGIHISFLFVIDPAPPRLSAHHPGACLPPSPATLATSSAHLPRNSRHAVRVASQGTHDARHVRSVPVPVRVCVAIPGIEGWNQVP